MTNVFSVLLEYLQLKSILGAQIQILWPMVHGKLPTLICNQEYYRLEFFLDIWNFGDLHLFFFQKLYSGTWTRTREPVCPLIVPISIKELDRWHTLDPT